jgi:alpha-L-arabinofuranosidase
MRNPLRIALQQDSSLCSNAIEVTPTNQWSRYTYQLTATEDASQAALTISSDSAAVFWMDVVSLFPEKTFKGRKNGMRADLMNAISQLKPSFVRYPAGEFLNGYTAGTYPQWEQTIGDIAARKHFWSGAGYGVSNGFGYDEFLQLCEDLDAEPIYVVNSGITSQSRRPRYEEIKNMDKLVEQTLAAIAYANAPIDSLQGMLRAKNGHPEPYNLKSIEIGSDNFGPEYIRRLNYFKTAIHQLDSSIQVIATEKQSLRSPNTLTDRSFGADNSFLIGQHNLFNYKIYPRQEVPLMVSGFSSIENRDQATMEHAIAEAAFMIGMEQNPDRVKRIAYTPLLTNTRYANKPFGALLFNGDSMVATPSYYAFQLFATHAEGEVLKTHVTSASKPQVTAGGIGFYLFDNAFKIENVTIDKSIHYDEKIMQGAWDVASPGTLTPAPNKWNYLIIGDSTAHDYELQAHLTRTKGSEVMEIRLRDNAEIGASSSYIALDFGSSKSTLTLCSGTARQVLAQSKSPININNNETFRIRVRCKDDTLRTYLNDQLLHEYTFPPKPYLLALAKYNKEAGETILKVVNTSYRPERTALKLHQFKINKIIQMLQLKANNQPTNTWNNPNAVIPMEVDLPSSEIIEFPPQSISIIRLKVTPQEE